MSEKNHVSDNKILWLETMINIVKFTTLSQQY
jgi:hypothetical protein